MNPIVQMYPILNNEGNLCYGQIVVVYGSTKDIDNVKAEVKVLDITQSLFIE
jgi:hypothetical protein